MDSMASLSFKPLDGADGYLRWNESVLMHLHNVDVAHVLTDEPPALADVSGAQIKVVVGSMALRRVTQLEGADGYPRWKESMLLALNTAGVAHVLTDDPPPPPASGGVDGGGRATAVAKQWAREDAMCRGYILGVLSNRLFSDYVRHATGTAVWLAVANADALGVAGHGTLADGVVADTLLQKLPQDVYDRVEDPFDDVTMEAIWGVVRAEEEARQRMEAGVVAMADMPSPEDQVD
ncbi:hypothetical protein EJB05_49030, partial [Eragrostis curvula]